MLSLDMMKKMLSMEKTFVRIRKIWLKQEQGGEKGWSDQTDCSKDRICSCTRYFPSSDSTKYQSLGYILMISIKFNAQIYLLFFVLYVNWDF